MLREISLQISNAGTRQVIREKVVQEFLKEEPGTGTGDLSSKYNYYVETLLNGNRIFLSRPAFLNKGFDFVVKVEAVNFGADRGRARNSPRHSDVIQDLEVKREENLTLYKLLYALIQRIYFCEEITKNDYAQIRFTTGLPADLIVFVIKWMFIEQDITYWNFSGRNMFMSKIPMPPAQ